MLKLKGFFVFSLLLSACSLFAYEESVLVEYEITGPTAVASVNYLSGWYGDNNRTGDVKVIPWKYEHTVEPRTRASIGFFATIYDEDFDELYQDGTFTGKIFVNGEEVFSKITTNSVLDMIYGDYQYPDGPMSH